MTRPWRHPRTPTPADYIYTGTDYNEGWVDDPETVGCVCFDPRSMEYGPNYPCDHCKKLEATS